MKKIILTAICAVATLSLISCNKVPAPIEYTPEAILTFDVAELMRNGLYEVFAYEEMVSKKITSGETVDPAITVFRDLSNNVTGWESNFTDPYQNFLGGKITVEFVSIPLHGPTRQVDCSEITIPRYNLKLFGAIAVELLSTSETETERRVMTNSFGWGATTNAVNLTESFYTFTTKYSTSGEMTECKIKGSALGHHVEYLDFRQITDMDNALTFSYNTHFISGDMTLLAEGIGNGILPIEVTFTPSTIVVRYNGTTQSY